MIFMMVYRLFERIRYEWNQGQMAGTFDRTRQHPLEVRGDIGDPPGKNFALLVQIPLEQFNVFVIDVLDIVEA